MVIASSHDSAHPARLRVMVRPHELVRGGSQLNAIDLAAHLRDRGHEVEVYAPPGPLVAQIESHGLPYRAAPTGDPAGLRAILSLSREIARFSPDIVHNFEANPSVTSAAASFWKPHRTVTTVLSMDVPDFVPRHAPLIVGTAALAADAATRCADVHLVEPPVDTAWDAPGDVGAARRRLDVESGAFVVAVVGRLSAEHQKARGIVAAIDAMAVDPDLPPTVLLIAGDGDETNDVVAAAERAAAASARLDVRLLGDVGDPRPVYDAADVVFGMGSSALRAMAHRKPVIVQGRDDFWQLLTPDSAELFLAQGFFGEGSTGAGFLDALRSLDSAARREELGAFGHDLVRDRFAFTLAAERIEGIYTSEIERSGADRRALMSIASSLFRFARYRVALAAPGLRRGYRRLTGRAR